MHAWAKVCYLSQSSKMSVFTGLPIQCGLTMHSPMCTSMSPCTLTIFLFQWSWLVCFVTKCFVHMCTSEENGVVNEGIVLSDWFQVLCETSKLWKSDGCPLFSVRRKKRFENKWTEEEDFGHLVTFWFGSLQCFLCHYESCWPWKYLNLNGTLL